MALAVSLSAVLFFVFTLLLVVCAGVRLHFLGGFRRRLGWRRVVSMRSAWAVALAASDAKVCLRAVTVVDIWCMVVEIDVVAACVAAMVVLVIVAEVVLVVSAVVVAGVLVVAVAGV